MNLNEFIKNNVLEIIVHPNSSKNKIIGYDKERCAVKVNIKAPPEDNKANIEVMKFFSKELGKKVKIIYGLKSKRKILKFL